MAPANSSHKAPSKARQVTKTVSKPRGAYGSREYRNWHPLKQKLRLVAIDDAVVKLIEANKAGKKYRAAKELAAEIRKAGFSAWKSDLEKWSTEELNGLYQLVKDPKLDKGAAPKHHEGLLNKLQTIQRRYIRDDRVWPPSIVTAVITNETAV